MGNLASAVDELLAVDVRQAPAAQLHDEVAEILRERNRLDAEYLRRVEAVDRRGVAPEEFCNTQIWLRAAFRLSSNTAHRDVRLARTLVDVLPLTVAAMRDGDVSVDHAVQIAALRRVIKDTALTEVERHLVAIASERDPNGLRKAVAHVKDAYAPDKHLKDEQDLHAQRSLTLASTLDGEGVGKWNLPGASQETVATAIHALSAPAAGDDRTAAQRRADALVTMAELALKSGQLPVTGGVKPHVSIIINADTVAEPLTPRPLPGELFTDLDDLETALRQRAVALPFGGTVTATWTRRWLCDAAVSRIVLSAAGEVLDVGRATRVWNHAQIRAITARDRTCRWPGCDTPAAWCEVHHITHWADGGPTDITNGILLCGRHHDRVHLHGHAITRKPNGHYTVDTQPATDPTWTGPRHRAGP